MITGQLFTQMTAPQALALESGESALDEPPGSSSSAPRPPGPPCEHAAFYEITIASADQPKLLSRLTDALVSA